MPKISEVQREARRQNILDAALRCFSRNGFHATTTADLVRESGVSQGALYLYFATKEDIIRALADDRQQRAAYLATLAQDEQDPVRGLVSLIHLHGQGLADPARSDIRRASIQGWAEALRDARIRDGVVRGFETVRAAMVRLIERGQRTGQFRPEVDPDGFARTLIAIFQGMLLQVSWDEPVDLSACGETLSLVIRDAILTPAGRAHAGRFPLDPAPPPKEMAP